MNALYATLIIVILDQASKLYIKGFSVPFLNLYHKGMSYHSPSIPVIGEFFRITYVENPGMAFGIEVNPVVKLLVSLFSILASVGLFYYLYSVRKQFMSLRLSIAFILGGAIGNLIDRVFYGVLYGYEGLFHGRVVDFLHFTVPQFTVFGRTFDNFPIFNIADTSVTIGVFLMLIFYKKHNSINDEPVVEVVEAENVAADSELVHADGEQSLEAHEYNSELTHPIEEKESTPGAAEKHPESEAKI